MTLSILTRLSKIFLVLSIAFLVLFQFLGQKELLQPYALAQPGQLNPTLSTVPGGVAELNETIPLTITNCPKNSYLQCTHDSETNLCPATCTRARDASGNETSTVNCGIVFTSGGLYRMQAKCGASSPTSTGFLSNTVTAQAVTDAQRPIEIELSGIQDLKPNPYPFPASHDFYEQTDLSIRVNNCSEESVTLSVYEGRNVTCSATGCSLAQFPDEVFGPQTEDTSNGSATFTHSDIQDANSPVTNYIAVATCGSETKQLHYRVWDEGEDSAKIVLPPKIIEMEPFTASLVALDDGKCYWVTLKQNGGNYIPAQELNCDTNWDNAMWTKEGDREEDVPVIGLEKGEYTMELGYEGVDDIDKVEFKVCSADDSSEDCINAGESEADEELPPPKDPPCAEFDTATGGCIRINSALGPIGVEPASFVRTILGILLSISGGIAVLLIIRSGYQFMTSRGNPDVVQEARDRLTSAIVGLLFIIFSLVILQVIGVDILQIPGFEN